MAIAAGCCGESASALCLRRAGGSHPPLLPPGPLPLGARALTALAAGAHGLASRGINRESMGRPWPGGGIESKADGIFRCWSLTWGVLLGVEQMAALGGFGARASGGPGGFIPDLNAVWKGKSMYRMHTGKAVCQWPLPGD